MPRSIPDISTLLAAVAKYLEQELMPTLSGYHRFQTRVTVNVLNIIRREIELREEQESAEHDSLRAILGHGGSIEVLNNELCELIHSGQIDINDARLRAHIKQSLAHTLAINNPKWTGRNRR